MAVYGNETGLWDYEGWEMADGCQWLVTPDGELYIIPPDDVTAEIDGPDTPLLSVLNTLVSRPEMRGGWAVEESGWITDAALEKFHLSNVSCRLRRFNEIDGLYCA